MGTAVMITIILIFTLAVQNPSIGESSEESELITQSDVIMPTKVSRPGCEKIDRMLHSISDHS